MSKVARAFRIRVNGTVMGRQLAAASGNWCYIAADNPTLGSPLIYEVVVILKRGINTIEIGLNSTELAPFIDKIKLEKAELNGLGLEAELAELTGSNVNVACTTASNGALINMGLNMVNGIRFNNLIATESKTYFVDIHYITKADRNMRVSMNGQPFTTEPFVASGNWCFEGGTTKVKTIELNFSQGSNTIEFKPTGADAPFIDKIVLREAEPVVTTSANMQDASVARFNNQQLEQIKVNTVAVYPNPVQAGTPITVSLPDVMFAGGAVTLQITDVTGRLVFSQNLPQQTNRQVKLENNLSKGMYVLSVSQGLVRTSKKVIVQ